MFCNNINNHLTLNNFIIKTTMPEVFILCIFSILASNLKPKDKYAKRFQN